MRLDSMTKFLLLPTLILLLSCHSSDAQDYKSSIGLRLGTYFAGSFTTYVSEKASVELLAGISREANRSQWNFGGFYKIHNSVASEVPTLNWYFGAGLYVRFTDIESEKVKFAPSGILGMEYSLEHTPVNFFVDVSPHYRINSGPGFDVHASMGVRYIINRPE